MNAPGRGLMAAWTDPDELVGLRVERRGPVAIFTIDRPRSRNSLTLAGHADLVRRWSMVQEDAGVAAMIITGIDDPSSPSNRQSFCSGADMKELASKAPSASLVSDPPSLASVPHRIPVIAAVNGYCIGAGLTMMLAADLRVAAPGATFGLPELRLGTLPGNGGVCEAILQLPRAIAMELLLLPDRMGAERARELGLINAIVPHDQVLGTALKWAGVIATLPNTAVQSVMELAAIAPNLTADDAARLERRLMRRVHEAAARSEPEPGSRPDHSADRR
jgi:E-phenylitaconyl-CoA hydratase